MLQGNLDVETAFSSYEAFKKMEKTKPDVIVSSFQMRGENPCFFLRDLRDKCNAPPFIGLIADDENDLAHKASHLGANGFVKKFGDPEVVFSALKNRIVSVARTA